MFLNHAETDWLASRNIFYDTRTNQISDNINDLIDANHIEFHPEGLCNYLDYGYCVYGQTPIREIKILPANRKIYTDESGLLRVDVLDDPFDESIDKSTNEDDVIEYIHALINNRIEAYNGEIIVPTSGGFDSRFINSLIDRKDRILAYTYGISEVQSESMETVYAKRLCELLDIKWKQIELGEFHKFINDWYRLYGISTHAHGMYQMEFYEKISKQELQNGLVISGIYGDLWAGSWKFNQIKHPDELVELAITHGIHADSNYCKLKNNHELRDNFFEAYREKLKDSNWRIVLAARMKVPLISYLLRVPESVGFATWSPFLDFKAVSQMLNLDWGRKERRKWQVEYFRKNGILLGEMGLVCDFSNNLDEQGYRCEKLKPLDSNLLKLIIKEEYIEAINKNIQRISQNWLEYYCAYLTLFPLQKLLEKREDTA